MTKQPNLPPEQSSEKTAEESLEFETALEKLEGIVENMESGDLTLSQALQQFEQGMKLATFCTRKLGTAEKRIEKLVLESDNRPEWEPFDADDDRNQ